LEGSILQKISEKDYLLNAPYQSYSYLIKFLREAALDPLLPLNYFVPLSKEFSNHQFLINAAKNGKKSNSSD
jgi:polyphosphate kinase